jgi:hypothetical protein
MSTIACLIAQPKICGSTKIGYRSIFWKLAYLRPPAVEHGNGGGSRTPSKSNTETLGLVEIEQMLFTQYLHLWYSLLEHLVHLLRELAVPPSPAFQSQLPDSSALLGMYKTVCSHLLREGASQNASDWQFGASCGYRIVHQTIYDHRFNQSGLIYQSRGYSAIPARTTELS